MRFERTLIVALALIGCSSPHARSDLPKDMAARFSPSSNYAERIHVTAPGAADTLRADISFSNDGTNEVSLRWTVQATGAYETVVGSEHPVSFQPTAVARRAGTSSIFYVVGWSSETARVIVERWTLGAFDIAPAASPSGEPGPTTLTLPPVTRTELWVSDHGKLQPIWDAVCSPYAGELWLLESGPVTRIHALDLGGHTLEPRYASDDAGMADLAGHRSFGAGQHTAHGFVILSQPKRPWDSLRHQSRSAMVFVVTDTDSDGSTDAEEFLTFSDYGSTYAGGWDMKYPGR
jgi:hypothetical protein